MHQPYYRDPLTGGTRLPWVRLHALKDYYGMVHLLREFPGMRAVFNLVPSMLVQLESYARGEKDIYQELTAKDAASLEGREVDFLLRHFFSANYRHLVRPYPRFDYLFHKREQHGGRGPDRTGTAFTTAELRDIQVWFPLCHFDEFYKKEHPGVRYLLEKGQDFSEADKVVLEQAELELLRAVIPEYRALSGSGQVELSTTPFYHPILPLLLDPQAGRAANPGLPHYHLHFNWKEDARRQLQDSLAYMEKTFGEKPAGLWPSEGSLSGPVLEILEELGIAWTASDELVLSKSLGLPLDRDGDFSLRDPGVLYRPYVPRGKKIKVFFRDHHLSDLIGFFYQKMPAQKAAADFVDRIRAAANKIPGNRSPVVPVILDGENAWEYYPGSGREFLRELFRRIMEAEELQAATFSQCLEDEPGVLETFSPGSWINANFDIWIGDPEDRRAWDLLAMTREALEKVRHLPTEQWEQARRYLDIAQGSDWFWWFGTEHYTPDLDIFDSLFRDNLKKVYQILGLEIPDELYRPVSHRVHPGEPEGELPGGPVHPQLDGRFTSYLEWLNAGSFDFRDSGGAMHITNPLAEKMLYGFGNDHFYFALQTPRPADQYFKEGYSLHLHLGQGKEVRTCSITGEPGDIECVAGDILEGRIPLDLIQPGPGETLHLKLEWRYRDEIFQVLPENGVLSIKLPASRDYHHNWQV